MFRERLGAILCHLPIVITHYSLRERCELRLRLRAPSARRPAPSAASCPPSACCCEALRMRGGPL